MIVLFTDFGWQGPYVGLLKSVLMRHAPTIPIVDLFHDVPAFNVQAAAYLLATYALEFPSDTVFIGVVDPGVGGMRNGLIVKADGRLFIGPDNGLFERVIANAQQIMAWQITWQPPRLSASFHGRDLFAPIAVQLALGMNPDQFGVPTTVQTYHWPDDLAQVIYIDHYGNAMTGIRASRVSQQAKLGIRHHLFTWARTFCENPKGMGFWYENSSGLVELAVSQGNAAQQFALQLGDKVIFVK